MDVIPVFILVPPDTLLIDIAGPLEVLRYANQEQDRVRFDYRYISAKPRQQTSIGLVLDGLEPLPDSLPENAILVISGSLTVGIAEIAREAELKTLTRWLAGTVRSDTKLATICSGALLAAAAGLMEGHQCTTHAECLDELRALAPTASVLENRLYVEDGNRFSSAGISTGIDLMLHLVSRLASPQAALAAARKMVIYLRRSGQDPQMSPWLSGRNHIHPAIHRAQDAIMADPARDWSLPRLAEIAHLSERHLSRLFREHVGLSVVDYVNLMRVTLAQELLKQSRLDMENLAHRAGFTSSRHMRRVFAQHHGLSPSAFRKTAD
ncbi:AraC family transcriptional regulator [Rhizobium sp. Root274]|uniref:GlxA family transcriptional regulator n=1 Tax=unclassified Rhizobium TaxID=2613769 RepID=UPI0007138B3B|nr:MULTISPECIES: helix-turn-helix domain-containing protein [unclassified Rhizobium]KQW32010.1 AraC family transcriptional regulator [Rhizobium sp. Root1240]KRD33548.1 AraC family transcriptional regulator [Rhizobium sp. Root274]